MNEPLMAENLAFLYEKAASAFGDLPAFATRKEARRWEPLSFNALYERGLNLATGLIDLGVEAREHVGLFADNHMDWIIAYCGVQLGGAADVPRGNDVTEAELEYIINHAGIKVAFVETDALLEKIKRIKKKLPGLTTLILLDPAAMPSPNTLRLQDLIEKGAALRKKGDRRVEERIAGIRPDDLITLIYTYDTTGTP